MRVDEVQVVAEDGEAVLVFSKGSVYASVSLLPLQKVHVVLALGKSESASEKGDEK